MPLKPPATRPLCSVISCSALLMLSLLFYCCTPECGLWPMDECYILAVSTGFSWGLPYGGSAVSGPVCQLLILFPPQRALQSVTWTYAEPPRLSQISDFKMKEPPLRIGIFIALAVKKGLFKCCSVVFLNRPQKLWQTVFCFTPYFISRSSNRCFPTSEETPL